MLTLYRVIPGIVFILSGFLKAIDPVGGALKIEEYLNAFHLSFLESLSLPVSMIMSCVEFIIGVSLLKGLNMKRISVWALAFMCFFTPLTLYSAIFNPVKECGCFGEAVHLSNWASFGKNVVLLGAVIMVFINRKKYSPIALPLAERVYTGCYIAFIAVITVWAALGIPQVDFTPLRPGTDLSEIVNRDTDVEYETVFIYSKDGREEEFTIDNLPDSTWSFVSANTTQISGPEASDLSVDFVLKDGSGNYVTQEILGTRAPLFFISIYNGENIGGAFVRRVEALRDSLFSHGAYLYAVSGDARLDWNVSGVPLLNTDYKVSLSFNRSNGGLVYVREGMIVRKWSRRGYPASISDLLERDYEVIAVNKIIREQLFLEFSLLLIFAMIFIVRYISRRYYLRYKSRTEERED